MRYTKPQRQLLVESFVSKIGLEDFWKGLGSGQKQNAIESINYYCHSPLFSASNEAEIEKILKKVEEGDKEVPEYDYQFEFEWHIPGVNQKATIRRDVPSRKFEALR